MEKEKKAERTGNERPSDVANEKIPVAFCITELAAGGAEKALLHLVSEIDRTRFIPAVYVLSDRPEHLVDSLEPLFREAGIETVNLGMRRARDCWRVFWSLRRLLKNKKTLVFQSFLFHANFFGRFAARAAGVPVVCAGVRVAERDSPIRLKLDYWTRTLCDVWICVGESVAAFTQKVGKISGKKIVSIPNGVRLQTSESKNEIVFSPANALRNITNDNHLQETPLPAPFGCRKRILCVGRLTRQKGLDWLLENAPNWLTPKIANDWELWIVGDGEERSALTQLVQKQQLENDVVLTGRRRDVPELLANSELFVAPSRWEGMSNSLLEAAAAGKAVVCANVEGVAEILGDSAAPQTCDFGDSNAWTEKISTLIRDEKLRRELGRRNRERVLAEFTVEKTARKYENIWLKILQEKQLSSNRNRETPNIFTNRKLSTTKEAKEADDE